MVAWVALLLHVRCNHVPGVLCDLHGGNSISCPAAYIAAAPLERFAVQTPLVAALAAIVHVLRVL
jgi:hypothetical protein